MTKGLTIDEIMAIEVMGWRQGETHWHSENLSILKIEDFTPSEDWAYAGMIVDTLLMEYQNLHFRLYSRDNGFEANFINKQNEKLFYVGTAPEAPEAICLAAKRLLDEE